MYHVTSDEGESSYWSFTHDITERLHYESQIKRLNSIMDTTMENLPAGIVVKDVNSDFCYIYRNRESYNRDMSFENETTGMTDFDYYPQEVAEQKRKEDMEVAATGKCKHWVTEEKDKNGNLIILDKQKIKVEGKDFSPVVISIEWDITQLELMKRELMISKEKAETSDNMKSAFLANMSHEIRTPLNAIVGFSSILADAEEPEEKEEYINDLLLQLINDILDISKIEAGVMDFTENTVELNQFFQEIESVFQLKAKTGIEIKFIPEQAEEYAIKIDRIRLNQVISNFLNNALKFPRQGHIFFGYRRREKDIYFYVEDTGIGIPKDQQASVFRRFVKLNNFIQGTGLGLSICSTIIDKFNGKIGVESEPEKGSTFWFTIPRD